MKFLFVLVIIFSAIPVLNAFCKFHKSNTFYIHNIKTTTNESFSSFSSSISAMDMLKSSSTPAPLTEFRRNDGHELDEASIGSFIATAAMIPVAATTILPLTILWQVGYSILSPILPKKPKEFTIDSGYKVQPDSIIPRPKRQYDIVLLGATGFAGKLAAKHLAKTYGVDKDIKWAIAGRSQQKLDAVKKDLAAELGDDSILKLETIIVDTSVASTLPNLVRDTRTVATTVGPFTAYGSFVVEFCAKFGTHYTDITGEVDWVKTMMLKWEETAKETGAKLVSFCGNDCIPWDLTVYHMEESLKKATGDKDKEEGEELVNVICANEISASASGGTIATMALGLGGEGAKAPTTDPFRNTIDGSQLSKGMKINLPILIQRNKVEMAGKNTYGSPFLLAIVNAAVVRWSETLRGNQNLTYTEYSISPDFKTAFVQTAGLVMFLVALLNPLSSTLLTKYVLPKPGEGPSTDKMENKSFLSLKAQGSGSKGSIVEAVMYFPKCPGYLETGRMVVESALCLALEETKLPIKRGGFFSPSVAMGDHLLSRLQTGGTKFECRVLKA